jgi:hypothetical protein
LDKVTQCRENQENEPDSFQDPAKKSWVWMGLIVLILGMTPFWPITGDIWGYPRWVVFAVFMSFLTSVFIAAVILFVWKDSENKKNGSS